jgi:hypothetical protein
VTPWTIIASASGAMGMSIAAFFFGVSYEGNRIRAKQLVEFQVEQARAASKQLQINAASFRQGKSEAVRGETVREIYREVAKIVDRPVYRNVCLDADGLRILSSAAATANGVDRPETVVSPSQAAPAASDGGSRTSAELGSSDS